MTRKDYELLADALRGAYPIAENNTPGTAWDLCVSAIAEALKHDNPRFDPVKFFDRVDGRSVTVN